MGFALGAMLKVLEIIFAAIAEVISGLVTLAACGSGTGNTDYFQIALHKMPDRPAFYFKHGPFYNLYFHPPHLPLNGNCHCESHNLLQK